MKIKLTNALFKQRKGVVPCVMRAFLLLCCSTIFGFPSDHIFSQNVDLRIEKDQEITVYEVFDLIQKQTKYNFIYQADIFKDSPKVQLKKGTIKADKLLRKSLPNKEYKIIKTDNNYVVITRILPQQVQHVQRDSIKVHGVVKDVDGQPLLGVTVRELNTQNGVSTDLEGNYTIYVAGPESILQFTSIGFNTKEVVLANQTTLNITLEEATTELAEVTLNAGYYKVKDRERTGSISKVSREVIEKDPLTNPISSLQGRVAGVDIVQTAGVPGAGFVLRIRGNNNIRYTANEPLYIIDGVPFSTVSMGSFQTSGSVIPDEGISPLNNLNAADIDHIEILKDADATSIYGSRGANGVVLITTKKGTQGRTSFQLNMSSGIGSVANKIDFLDPVDYYAMRKEAYANDGIVDLPSDAYDINGTWDQERFTDWQDVLIGKTANLTSLQGSLSGGNEQTNFLISGNFNRQTTVFPGDYKNDKISILTSFQHHTANDKLKLQFSANFTTDENYLPSANMIRYALALAPNAPKLYNEDGSLNWENSTWTNPLSDLLALYTGDGMNLIANTTVDYKITDRIKLLSNIGYTQSHLKEIQTTPSSKYNPAYGRTSATSLAVHNRSERKSWIVEPQLHGNFTIGNTEFQSLVGLTFQEQKSSNLFMYAYGFTNNSLIESITAAKNLIGVNETDLQYRYHAFYGRVNINHQGKYLLNLTARRDGSSRFGSRKKFSNFGGVGAAWIFSKESFLLGAFPMLSFGKIRGSFGTSGSDQIGDYQYLDTYSFDSSPYQGDIGLYPTRLFNPDFSWEKNEKLELALELGLLNDRILLSGSFYRNRSSNQLVGIPLPGTTGFSALNGNLNATVENTGWEFEVNSVNIDNEKFKWATSFNLTFPKNRLLAFPDLEGSSYKNTLKIGESINILKLYESKGVNPQSGLYEFTDVDQDGTISYLNDANKFMNLNPTYYGGLSNQLSYKNVKLDILFQFTKQLGKKYLASAASIGSLNNQPKGILDRWQKPGDVASLQRLTSGASNEVYYRESLHRQSTGIISDASFIRLKTLSLSYQLPLPKSSGFNCQLFLRGQNLLTFTKFDGPDPETRSNSSLPPLQFFTLGTNVSF
ncbi:SusC/RagA family TonB-linked outer membrane protein [Flavobacteriaceae bacterium F08102]|nr:SusC/RagA family TonB-linked outer membrane protein [Flavobacteriaceae bacterium F08102]